MRTLTSQSCISAGLYHIPPAKQDLAHTSAQPSSRFVFSRGPALPVLAVTPASCGLEVGETKSSATGCRAPAAAPSASSCAGTQTLCTSASWVYSNCIWLGRVVVILFVWLVGWFFCEWDYLNWSTCWLLKILASVCSRLFSVFHYLLLETKQLSISGAGLRSTASTFIRTGQNSTKVSGGSTSICLGVLKVSSLQGAFYTKHFLRDGIREGGSSEAGLPARCPGREQADALPEEVN